MALPAEIFFTVGCYIYSGNEFIALSAFMVTFAAISAANGFARQIGAGIGFMFFGNNMTLSTFQHRVRREGFRSCDMGVAGTAFAGNFRGGRSVRIMTGDARLDRVMSDRVDLRKPCRFSGIILMAKWAGPSFPWHCGQNYLILIKAGDMSRGRAVASFTINGSMIRVLFYIIYNHHGIRYRPDGRRI